MKAIFLFACLIPTCLFAAAGFNRQPVYGLVGWWTFNEGTGTNATDYSGIANHAGTSNATWQVGKLGPYSVGCAGGSVASPPSFGIPTPGGAIVSGVAWDPDMSVYHYINAASTNFGNAGTNYIGTMTTGGVFISQFQITNYGPGGNVQGLTYRHSDTSLYYIPYHGTNIGHYSVNGSFIEKFAVTNTCNGIAYDSVNNYLWVCSDTDPVITVYNANTGAFVKTTTTSLFSSDGIFYDSSDNSLWITADPKSVYHVNTNGTTITNWGAVYNIEHLTINGDGNIFLAVDQYAHNNVPRGDRFYTFSKAGAMIPTPTWTLSAWIYPTNVAGATGVIFDNLGQTETFPLFNLFTRTTGSLGCNVGTSMDSATGLIVNSNWQHVAETYDGTNMRLYRNGLLLTNASRTLTTLNHQTTAIGSSVSTANSWKGNIDDARVYSRALSFEEIKMIYGGGWGR